MTSVASTFTFLTKRRGGLLTVIGLMLILAIFGMIMSDKFGTASNAINILEQSSPLAIVSLGQTLVIITGGIDLSVGSMVSLASVLLSGITAGEELEGLCLEGIEGLHLQSPAERTLE